MEYINEYVLEPIKEKINCVDYKVVAAILLFVLCAISYYYFYILEDTHKKVKFVDEDDDTEEEDNEVVISEEKPGIVPVVNKKLGTPREPEGTSGNTDSFEKVGVTAAGEDDLGSDDGREHADEEAEPTPAAETEPNQDDDTPEQNDDKPEQDDDTPEKDSDTPEPPSTVVETKPKKRKSRSKKSIDINQ